MSLETKLACSGTEKSIETGLKLKMKMKIDGCKQNSTSKHDIACSVLSQQKKKDLKTD